MPDEKVTFAAAARTLGVHVNSVKNWNAAGKFKTSEKVQVKGVDKWVVSLAEVQEVHQFGRTTLHNNQDNNQIYNQVPIDTQQLVVLPEVQQALTFFKENNSRLLESLDKQTARIEELARENGELRERVRALEAAETRQGASTEPVWVEPQSTQQPPQEPQRERSWLYRWFRRG